MEKVENEPVSQVSTFPHFKVTHAANWRGLPLFKRVRSVEMDGQVLPKVVAVDVHHAVNEVTTITVTFYGSYEEVTGEPVPEEEEVN